MTAHAKTGRQRAPGTAPADGPLKDLRFLTVAEIAALMRVSLMTVHRLISEGELQAVRFGRGYRVEEQELARYLAAGGTGGRPLALPVPPPEDKPTTEKPPRRPGRDRAVDVIRGLIADGTLKPGDELPYASVLAADTGVHAEHFKGAYRVLVESGELVAAAGVRRLRVAEAPETSASGSVG